MTVKEGTLSERLSEVWSLWPYMVRATKIVWKAAPGWSSIWLILLIIQGLLPVATVYLTRFLVDSLVILIDAGLDSGALRPSLLAIAAMLVVRITATLLGSFTGMVLTAQSELITDYMDNLVHEKSVSVDLAFYDSPDYYDRLYRARYRGSRQPLALTRAFGSLLQNSITFLAMAAVLLQYGFILPLALFASSIPAFFAVLHNRIILHEWRMRVTSTERRGRYYDMLLTSRESAAENRLFELGGHYRRVFQEIRATLRDEQISISKRQGFVELLANVFALLVLALALAWMLWQALQGLITLGDLALFYQAFNTGQGLMRSLLANVGDIYVSSLYLEDLFEFLDMQPRVVDPPEPLPAPSSPQLDVAFTDVRFQYPEGHRELLTNFNLLVEPGQFIAIVGRNGAGKSTLVKLLNRLYDMDGGQITIGGVDIRHMRLADLRRLITVLFQEPMQYNDTAAHNIAVGDLKHVGKMQIVTASEQAGADEIIRGLPEQYETLLGRWFAGGVELSVGEWQRLAMARAFIRNASIVVLDEPTSAMDPWAEAAWLQRFREYATRHTVILITHRFSTARYADLIYVMDEGKIIESGTHEALLAQQGSYAASWNASQRLRESRKGGNSGEAVEKKDA